MQHRQHARGARAGGAARAGRAHGQGDADQGQRQVHRHRVVHARLDLQRRRDPVVEPHARGLEQREHRRRVGGAHDGAHQQGQRPVQPQQPARRQAGDARAHHHTQRGQQQRRLQAGAEGLEIGAQAAVEQDDRQRHVAHPETELEIVEDQAAWPVFSRQHAGQQEHQQEGKPRPCRHHACQHADEHQRGCDEQGNGEEIEGQGHVPKLTESVRSRSHNGGKAASCGVSQRMDGQPVSVIPSRGIFQTRRPP